MVSLKLEKKIRLVVVVFVLSICIYLMCAFFMLSKYPLSEYDFDLNKSYEVLKDALTLAASFLAPVAAFVLFTDWRQEHVEKVLDSLARKIRVDINDIYILLKQAHHKPAVEIKKDSYEIVLIGHQSKGSILNMRLGLMNDLLELKNSTTGNKILIKKLEEFLTLSLEAENTILVYKYQENELFAAQKRAESDECLVVRSLRKGLLNFQQMYSIKIDELDALIKELDELLAELFLKGTN